MAAARDDLATRLRIDRGEVAVVVARSVTWRDTSLGCPQPGTRYLQRLVDGVLVVLEVEGVRYEYHGGDELFLCPSPTTPVDDV